MPQHEHRSTTFKHFRPQTLIHIETFYLVFSILSTSPVFSSVKLRSVFCAVVLSTCLRVPQLGSSRCAHAEIGGEHDETWSADDVDDNDPKLAVDLATQAFLDYMLDLADESKISAKDVCVLCWYESKAGMSDDVRRIGFRLDAPSGHYQRHLDSVLDIAERQSQFYKLHVVCTRKQDDSRSTFDMCVVPGHEVFHAEVEGDAGLSERLCHAKTTNGLPKHYHEHPVVKLNPNEDVFPVALNMDAVPYSLTDSVVGIWLVNLSSGNASCVNTVVGVVHVLHRFCVCEVVLRCLADGVFPSTRHDGAPLLPDSDSERAQFAGIRVKNRAACTQIRGDWAEFLRETWLSNVAEFVPPLLLLRSAASQLVRCHWCRRLFISTSFER